MDVMELTFSTQRYDPRLKRQLSLISGTTATASAIQPRSSFLSLQPSMALTVEEPLDENNPQLSHVRSLKSSDPASSHWHEGNSGGNSVLVNSEFFEDHLSHSSSATSFHLSKGEHSVSGWDGKSIGAKGKQPLSGSLMSVAQVEAHIPPPASMDSHYTEANEGDSGNDIQGQVRLVSSFSVRSAEANRVQESFPLAQPRRASEPPSLSRRSDLAHPEYDSECDEYTDSAESILTSSSGFAGDEADGDGVFKSRPANGSADPSCSFSSSPDSKVHRNSLPQASSSSPSPTPSRTPNPTSLRAAVLSDIYEEDTPDVDESTTKLPVSSHSSYPESLLPMEPAPLLEDTPISSPASSSAEEHAWWRVFPRRRRAASDGAHSEHSDEIIEERRSESREVTQVSLGLASQARENTSPPPRQDMPATYAEVKQEKRLPIPPLPSAPSCCLPSNRYRCSRAKSRARKVLSAIFPCIPVSDGGKDCDGENEDSSTTEGVGATPTTRHLMKKRKEEPKGRLVKKKSSTLEVMVERRVSHVMDYHSSS